MGTDTFDHDNYCKGCGQVRNAKYYYSDRMKSKETQLAEIRRALGVSGRSQKTTMDRIDVLNLVVERFLEAAAKTLREQKWAEEAHRRMFL